jgi:drug/metabolite transporter (DMT)-like permease
LYGYGQLKHSLIDSVDRKSLPSLIFRCTQGGLSVFISFMCIKFFNVSTVGIVCSLTPLFVCLIAYWLLGERLKTFDQVALVAVFVSVLMVILGAKGEESETMGANPLALIALISQPILLAAGCVAMR